MQKTWSKSVYAVACFAGFVAGLLLTDLIRGPITSMPFEESILTLSYVGSVLAVVFTGVADYFVHDRWR